MNDKILIAEDEENIRKLVTNYLVNEGFKVIQAADGQEAIEKYENNDDFVLIMLDVMMPGLDGYEVCKYIRHRSETPILMLTAATTENDELTGFKCGADEYISKPFSPTILVTRVKNILRRTASNSHQNIDLGYIKILYREHAAILDGKKLPLTPKEFDLLYYLMQNKNIVLSRDQILNSVWDMDYCGEDRTVDTHIKCLRAKMGSYGNRIVTVRKVGYKFEHQA